tara:strand:+ start:309 stop:869 length:561 start_codon:yes stop_codon:yes gene_type:complete
MKHLHRTINLNLLAIALVFQCVCIAQVYADEERIKDVWTVDGSSKDDVYLSVNGGVVYGDRLIILIRKKNCQKGTLVTTVYSYKDPAVVSQLDGKEIEIEFDGREMKAIVVSTNPFLMGSRTLIQLMNLSLDRFIKTIRDDYTLAVTYLNTPIGSASKFFDINTNNWKMQGVKSAVQRAQKICRAL